MTLSVIHMSTSASFRTRNHLKCSPSLFVGLELSIKIKIFPHHSILLVSILSSCHPPVSFVNTWNFPCFQHFLHFHLASYCSSNPTTSRNIAWLFVQFLPLSPPFCTSLYLTLDYTVLQGVIAWALNLLFHNLRLVTVSSAFCFLSYGFDWL